MTARTACLKSYMSRPRDAGTPGRDVAIALNCRSNSASFVMVNSGSRSSGWRRGPGDGLACALEPLLESRRLVSCDVEVLPSEVKQITRYFDDENLWMIHVYNILLTSRFYINSHVKRYRTLYVKQFINTITMISLTVPVCICLEQFT